MFVQFTFTFTLIYIIKYMTDKFLRESVGDRFSMFVLFFVGMKPCTENANIRFMWIIYGACDEEKNTSVCLKFTELCPISFQLSIMSSKYPIIIGMC